MIENLIPAIVTAFRTVLLLFQYSWKVLSEGFHWLTHLNLTEIWKSFESLGKYFKQAYAFLKKYLFDPIEAYRKQILAIYNHYFKPILRVMETVRHILDIVLVFNKKLAAKLDAIFFQLERDLLIPITAILKRVNSLSSFALAILTETGRFDATIFVETLQKQIKDCRRAFAGLPWQTPVSDPPPAPPTARQTADDYTEYLNARTGRFADYATEANRAYDQQITSMR